MNLSYTLIYIVGKPLLKSCIYVYVNKYVYLCIIVVIVIIVISNERSLYILKAINKIFLTHFLFYFCMAESAAGKSRI